MAFLQHKIIKIHKDKPFPATKYVRPQIQSSFINNGSCPVNMSKDEVEGKAKKLKGQIREEVGKITDNKTEQLKGKIEQVEGKAQEEIGKVKRKAKE